jgi:hypothetical protein
MTWIMKQWGAAPRSWVIFVLRFVHNFQLSDKLSYNLKEVKVPYLKQHKKQNQLCHQQ